MILAGQRVGLVGPRKAVKTTLMGLLLRMHDVDQGAIRIDEQDICEVTQESLRRSIALIPKTRTCFIVVFARTSGTADRARLMTKSSWQRGGRMRTSLSSNSITATTPWWASAASSYPVGSGSASRSRGRFSRMRRFCSWMKQPAYSTVTASTSFKLLCCPPMAGKRKIAIVLIA